ncbi:Oidioi.mRNA.OKI2018_I69.PAR.g9956.t1.cds [Oikopleura dioica]|uniref:Oidioi.mRNA.OKI2018_I69.PAR.g9956.t1.cds n=1 Tax=Oikopleura dioica TaxID=34765 RepID=A0ABN7RSH3_OIKDI|nr:Oidioi.mRNA.OKI2018_I69.PAR.g9956.t1.cds [Oikopleura dioica]
MKLSAVLALSSTVRAQDLDLADLLEGLEGIDLGDYGLTPDMFAESVADSATDDQLGEAALDSALAASAAAAELTGERYFGVVQATTTQTTPSTTTSTTYQKTGCFKCDQMTMAECAALGQFQYCEGEASMCFIELREVNQQVNQLCTGCKNSQACHDLQQQNFLGGQYHTDQCRPHYIEQRPSIRSPRGQSTCRQCFKQCEFNENTGVSDGMCFMGHDSQFADAGTNTFDSGATDANNAAFFGNRLIRYDQATIANNFLTNTAHPLYGYTGGASTVGFGIPTGAIVESGHAGATSIPGNAADTVWNLYFASGADGGNTGKTYPAAITASAQGQEQRRMAYWGVLGATRAWWASDLVAIQNSVAAAPAGDKTTIIAVV